MPPRAASKSLAFARDLRRRMTRAEEMLWRDLRNAQCDGLKFRRQVPVGRYVADFLCVEHRLIVELDGPPHDSAEAQDRDAARDAWLVSQGYTVLRFPNDIVIGGGDIALERIRVVVRKLKTSRMPSSVAC